MLRTKKCEQWSVADGEDHQGRLLTSNQISSLRHDQSPSWRLKQRKKRRKELKKQMHQQKYYELGKMHIQHIISNKVDVSISTTTIKENLKMSSQTSSDLFCVSEEVRTETKQTTNKSKNHKTSTSTFTLISLISIGKQTDKVIMTNIVMK